MARDLQLYPEDILDQACDTVEDPGNWDDLVEAMESVLYDHDGIGLAAPQVGEPIQLFLLRLDAEKRLHEAYFNPEIKTIEEKQSLKEGCLSFPNIEVDIERGTRVHFTGTTPAGKTVERTVEGLQAQCVQHEVDHLKGETLLDRCDLSQTMEIQDKLKMLEEGEIPPPDEDQRTRPSQQSRA